MTDHGRHSVTLQDVARHAGVSLATASRALNGSTRNVREDLKAKVETSALLLDYAPNVPAQAMARGRTDVIGLVVHDIADPYFSSIAAGVIDAAEAMGLLVTLASTSRSPQSEVRHVATLRAQRARAVILAGSRIVGTSHQGALDCELAVFEAVGGRAVLISQPRPGTDTITMDNSAGAETLAGRLVALGHRRHAILAGPRDFLTARDRTAGYLRGVAAAGGSVADRHIVHGDFTRDGGHAAAGRLLAELSAIDCIFAVNDVMAVGALAALREAGHAVPGSVALAGFDDIATLRDISPGLTTVRMPLREMGERALEMALAEPTTRARVHRVMGAVVLRESTTPVG